MPVVVAICNAVGDSSASQQHSTDMLSRKLVYYECVLTLSRTIYSCKRCYTSGGVLCDLHTKRGCNGLLQFVSKGDFQVLPTVITASIINISVYCIAAQDSLYRQSVHSFSVLICSASLYKLVYSDSLVQLQYTSASMYWQYS
jgi:hypothetical protein